MPYVNITYPAPKQNVTAGNFTIIGTSSDDLISDCTVYVGWNHTRPFQTATPEGTGGVEDYSTWNFTFTPLYHEIENGTNLLSSEISCSGNAPSNVTAAQAINVTGVANANGTVSNMTDIDFFSSAGSLTDIPYDQSNDGTTTDTLTSTDPAAYDSSGISYSSADDSISANDDDSNDGDSDSSSSDNNDDNDENNDQTVTCSGTEAGIPTSDGAFNIGAAGDWDSGTNARQTALNMDAKGVDLALGLGDYAYSTGSAGVCQWWNDQMAPLHGKIKGALGNHDTKDESLYAKLFGQSDQWFYSFDVEGVHFVAINTEESFGPGSSQYKFVEQDLQSASAKGDLNWIVVFLHQPMYTSPSHHDPVSSLRNAYHPLFDKYDVDIVLQGHNHNYQRSFPIMYNSEDPSKPIVTSNENGVYNDAPGQIYAEVGTGGKDSYSLDSKHPFISDQFTTEGGFLDLAFPNEETMEGTFYDNNGSVKDEFTIHKSGTVIALAQMDNVTTNEDTAVAIKVLTNDENQYGMSASTAASTLNPNLAVQIALQGNGPSHGTAHVDNNNQKIIYTPSPDYFGLDSFNYTIPQANSQGQSPKGSSAKVSVNVDPVNDAPQANNDNATSDEGAKPVLINVLANDNDPDNDSLEVIETSIASSSSTAMNGSTIINNGDGTITYKPPLGFNGVDSFSYTVSDGNNATSSASVEIIVNPINGPPQLPLGTNTTAANNSTEIQAANSSSVMNITRVNSDNLGDGVILDKNNTSGIGNFSDILDNPIDNGIEAGIDPGPLLFQNQTVGYEISRNLNKSIDIDNIQLNGYDTEAQARERAEVMAQEARSRAEKVLDIDTYGADIIAHSVRAELDATARSASDHSDSILTPGDQVRTETGQAKESLDTKISNAITQLGEAENSIKVDSRDQDEPVSTQVYDERTSAPSNDIVSDTINRQTHEAKENNEGIESQDHDVNKSKQEQKRSNAVSEDSTFERKEKPNADAGRKQTAIEGTRIALDGTDSKSGHGNKLSYSWKQTGGPKVKLIHDDNAVASFKSPDVPSGQDQLKLEFVLSVTEDSNSDGKGSDKDTVEVIIKHDSSVDERDSDQKRREQVRTSSDDKHRSSTEDSIDIAPNGRSKDNDTSDDNDKNQKTEDNKENTNNTDPGKPEEEKSGSEHANDQGSENSKEKGDVDRSNDSEPKNYERS